MASIKIGSVVIGEGRPKIILPIVESTAEAILLAAEQANELACDLVEWRVDHFNEAADYPAVAAVSKQIKAALNKPLLITFRSSREGGVREESDAAYGERYRYLLEQGQLDLLDLELFMPDELVKELIELAHIKNVKVVMCHHNFERTLSKEELVTYLVKMDQMQADICKIAMMPQEPQDVLTLMKATLAAKERVKRPMITMSMGGLGTISRIAGQLFGSAATFGIADKASAPGQLPIQQLEGLLQLLELN